MKYLTEIWRIYHYIPLTLIFTGVSTAVLSAIFVPFALKYYYKIFKERDPVYINYKNMILIDLFNKFIEYENLLKKYFGYKFESPNGNQQKLRHSTGIEPTIELRDLVMDILNRFESNKTKIHFTESQKVQIIDFYNVSEEFHKAKPTDTVNPETRSIYNNLINKIAELKNWA